MSRQGQGADTCVKEEDVPTERLCIKLEAESEEEAERWAQGSRYGSQQSVHIKQEASREDSAGLYADHEVKEELVLGPEQLQQHSNALMICGAASDGSARRAPHGAETETTSADKDTNTIHTLNSTNIVEINTYMCDICGKLFKHKKFLIGHIKRHLRETSDERNFNGEKALSCATCNKRFTQTGHLYRHERTHSGAKPHSCDVCKKEFTRVDTLRLHRVIHTGRKPYSCDTCDKQFTQQSNLTRHIRIHTGEKPYPCDVCFKRFTQSCDLKKHMRIHTGDKPFCCELCSKLFTCSGDLRTHKRTLGHKRAARTVSRRAV